MYGVSIVACGILTGKLGSNAGTSGVIGGKQKPPYDSGDNYNGTFRESNVGGRGNRNTVNVGNRPGEDVSTLHE